MTLAPARPAIPASRYAQRVAAARALLRERGAAALLVGVGAELRYLTGYQGLLTERLTMLVLPSNGDAVLVAPRLEAMAASGSPVAEAGHVRVVAWDETDDPHALVAGLLAAAGAAASPSSATPAAHRGATRILVSSDLWAMHVLGLQRTLPDRPFGLASEVVRDLRMVKDTDEIALLRLAARATDRVIDQIAAGRLVGRTEAEVAREIRDRLLTEGHETAEFAVVASGPNAASPHHAAGERRIAAGDAIVLDIGGKLGGYCSDVSRTLWVTGDDPAIDPDPDFLRIHALVRRAQAAATAAVRPGIACQALDAVARLIITDGGHGPDFIHRVGHGIGLEGHEEPYLVAGNAEALQPGVAFSIEPGIYLAGRFGVRIEDIVICGEAGPDVLNELPREVWVVAG